jgi:valyl-tRNA synthetase
MDLRPQSHEIIRTWAFYTIAKALLHEGTIPWKHAAISGWVLDPDRKKMSKSKGNVLTPTHLLDQFGSDAVRYWALSAKDRGFLARVRDLVVEASQSLEELEHARALELTEQFFWSRFTDTYVEMVKARARSEEDAAGRASAVGALRLGLKAILRLFAPFLPYITEEAWSWSFAKAGPGSIHQAPWPTAAELDAAGAGEEGVFDAAVAFLETVHRAKGTAGASVGRHLSRLRMKASPATADLVLRAIDDVLGAARVQAYALDTDPDVKDGVFEVVDLELAEGGGTAPAPPGA